MNTMSKFVRTAPSARLHSRRIVMISFVVPIAGRGDPGFSEPLKVGMEVMTPQGTVVHKTMRKEHH